MVVIDQLERHRTDEYVAPRTAAVEAVGIRGMQRRHQGRHLRNALHAIEVSSPDARRLIDSAVGWLARSL